MSTGRVRTVRRAKLAAMEPAGPRPVQGLACNCRLRPCPWVLCRYHLATDPRPSGWVRVNHDPRRLAEMPETCALDVAARGEHTLEAIGDLLGLTRERVRQVEAEALEQIAEKMQEWRTP